MDANEAQHEADDASVDHLSQQMNSTLRLAIGRATGRQNQPRRFSDTDRTRAAPLVPRPEPEPVAVRSRDGTRWLPAPTEQTRVLGSRVENSSEAANAVTSADAQQPHICDAAVCAVTTLFETTELLELVLSFLSPKDILNVRLTNSHWNSTIQQSPLLRLHFFYYPEFTRAAEDFQLLPLSMPGLSIELGPRIHLGRWIHVSFTLDAARKLAPVVAHSKRLRSRSIFEGLRGGLGSVAGASTDSWPASPIEATTSNGMLQYEDLFITQPPVVGMQAFLILPSSNGIQREGSPDPRDNSLHDSDEDEQLSACAKLSCDAGITLGFLAETAQSLLAPRKAAHEERETKVLFKAIVSFCKSEAAPRKRSLARSVTRIG